MQPQAEVARIARGRRRFWRDPRFITGLILIAISTTAGSWIVRSAYEGENLYKLTHPIAAGSTIGPDDVVVVVARTGTTGVYLPAGALPSDAVAERSLAQGEILPISAVVQAQDITLRPVVIKLGSPLPQSTGIGDTVDLWLVTRQDRTEAGKAAIVAQGLVVATIRPREMSLGAYGTVEVELAVPQQELAAVLQALGAEGSLIAVPRTI